MMSGVQPGRRIVQADLVGTAVFSASAAAGSLTDAWQTGSIVVSLVFFGLGIFAFIWSFFSAAERSRTDEIGVANLYLLTGRTAPGPVKRAMSAALAVQVVVGNPYLALGAFALLALPGVLVASRLPAHAGSHHDPEPAAPRDATR